MNNLLAFRKEKEKGEHLTGQGLSHLKPLKGGVMLK